MIIKKQHSIVMSTDKILFYYSCNFTRYCYLKEKRFDKYWTMGRCETPTTPAQRTCTKSWKFNNIKSSTNTTRPDKAKRLKCLGANMCKIRSMLTPYFGLCWPLISVMLTPLERCLFRHVDPTVRSFISACWPHGLIFLGWHSGMLTPSWFFG